MRFSLIFIVGFLIPFSWFSHGYGGYANLCLSPLEKAALFSQPKKQRTSYSSQLRANKSKQRKWEKKLRNIKRKRDRSVSQFSDSLKNIKNPYDVAESISDYIENSDSEIPCFESSSLFYFPRSPLEIFFSPAAQADGKQLVTSNKEQRDREAAAPYQEAQEEHQEAQEEPKTEESEVPYYEPDTDLPTARIKKKKAPKTESKGKGRVTSNIRQQDREAAALYQEEQEAQEAPKTESKGKGGVTSNIRQQDREAAALYQEEQEEPKTEFCSQYLKNSSYSYRGYDNGTCLCFWEGKIESCSSVSSYKSTKQRMCDKRYSNFSFVSNQGNCVCVVRGKESTCRARKSKEKKPIAPLNKTPKEKMCSERYKNFGYVNDEGSCICLNNGLRVKCQPHKKNEFPQVILEPLPKPIKIVPEQKKEIVPAPSKQVEPEDTCAKEPWNKKKFFKGDGKVNVKAFCKEYGNSKCKRSLESLIKNNEYVNKIKTAIDDLKEQERELELEKMESFLSDEEQETEASGLCIDCVKEVRALQGPTQGEKIASSLTSILGVGLSVYGLNEGRRAQRDANDLLAQQGFPAQNNFGYSMAGASLGYPFIAKGLYGLSNGNARSGGFSCSPAASPYGRPQYQMQQQVPYRTPYGFY